MSDGDGQLHVERRTGITIQTAVDTFLDGWTVYNRRNARYETYTETHGLYWTWLYGDETSLKILVISCFPNAGGT